MNQITVVQEKLNITVTPNPLNITVQQNPGFPQVTIIGNFSMQNFIPFTFTATQGQTVFKFLPGTPLAIWVFITGAGQNQAAGDFSVNGNVLTLSQGVNAGDTVYGVVQL